MHKLGTPTCKTNPNPHCIDFTQVDEQQWVKLTDLSKAIETFSLHHIRQPRINSYQIYIHKLNSVLNVIYFVLDTPKAANNSKQAGDRLCFEESE